MHRGIATFTLDSGHCPKWLFERMVKLGREMIFVMLAEYGPDELIKRLGDPVWFQTLGTLLAFDWNASGLTTILTAALKEAIRGHERDFGIAICGGKGKTSLKTPEQIEQMSARFFLPEKIGKKLIYNSRMSAKVDSSLVQDGFQLYHHAFFFSKNGAWTVVQQGMNKTLKSARRYHWHSENIHDLINEPHAGIISDRTQKKLLTLNMTAAKSAENRKISTELANSGYYKLIKEVEVLRRHSSELSRMISLKINQAGKNYPSQPEQLTLIELAPVEFHYHPVAMENFSKSKYLEKILWKISDQKPNSYEKLLFIEGVGPKTIRALSLISEVIYGAPASYEDPARYSFAHGGKDGSPFPVDRQTYDTSIKMLKRAIQKSKISLKEKQNSFRKIDF